MKNSPENNHRCLQNIFTLIRNKDKNIAFAFDLDDDVKWILAVGHELSRNNEALEENDVFFAETDFEDLIKIVVGIKRTDIENRKLVEQNMKNFKNFYFDKVYKYLVQRQFNSHGLIGDQRLNKINTWYIENRTDFEKLANPNLQNLEEILHSMPFNNLIVLAQIIFIVCRILSCNRSLEISGTLHAAFIVLRFVAAQMELPDDLKSVTRIYVKEKIRAFEFVIILLSEKYLDFVHRTALIPTGFQPDTIQPEKIYFETVIEQLFKNRKFPYSHVMNEFWALGTVFEQRKIIANCNLWTGKVHKPIVRKFIKCINEKTLTARNLRRACNYIRPCDIAFIYRKIVQLMFGDHVISKEIMQKICEWSIRVKKVERHKLKPEEVYCIINVGSNEFIATLAIVIYHIKILLDLRKNFKISDVVDHFFPILFKNDKDSPIQNYEDALLDLMKLIFDRFSKFRQFMN